MKEKVKLIIVIFIIIASVILSIYAGGWLLFLKPIFTACHLYDIGALTGSIIFKTIMECILSSIVSWIILSVGYVISIIIANL